MVQGSSEVPSASAQLIVSRTLDGDCGQRQVYVDLDGERLGNLLFGERFVQTVTAGRHFLKLNNTLVWKTIEFDAVAGETVQYSFANKAGRFALPFLAVMGVAPLYLAVERVTPANQR